MIKRFNFIVVLCVFLKYEVCCVLSVINVESVFEMVLECAKKDDVGCRVFDFL